MNSRVGARKGYQSRSKWAKKAAALLLSFATTSGFCSSSYAQAPGDPDLVYVSKLKFELPVQVDPAKIATMKELRLYASADKGRTWSQVRTAKPTQKSFPFEAPSDGEYWLTLAYVDKNNQQNPRDVQSEPPAQRIVVDTRMPRIDLQASRQRDGGTEINWRISDEKPDAKTMRLELQEAGEKTWQELNINRTISGSKSLPLDPTKSYTVRATVKDRAGNLGMQTSQISAESSIDALSSVPPAKRIQEVPTRRPSSRSTGELSQNEGADDGPFTIPKPPQIGESIPTTVSTSRKAPPFEGRATSYDPPMAMPANAGSQHSQPKSDSSIASIQAAMENIRRTQSPKPAPSARATEQEEPMDELLVRMMSKNTPIAASNKPKTQSPEPEAAAQVRTSNNPAKVVRIPLANSRSIAVDYGVRNLGPAGIGKVELYYTTDLGQSWTNAGEDPDKMPPFEVELPKEGRYGLKVVVTNKAGFGQRPPQKGESPQMLVEIDTKAPECVLFKPVPATNGENAMTLCWNAKDDHMSEKGVSLWYAEEGTGQWQIIKHNLPKSGTYTWRLHDGIPYQVQLRIVAQDLAGNMAIAETEQPVVVDLSKPEGEITNIATLPGASDARIR